MVRINCAVYVRKSTEKGLELEFNSLHNQEETKKKHTTQTRRSMPKLYIITSL